MSDWSPKIRLMKFKTVSCPRCLGTGRREDKHMCIRCNGKGRVRVTTITGYRFNN